MLGQIVACFECGVEYSGGRGNVKETALNAIKGFLAVSLFTQVPVRLYVLAVSLQADLTAGITALVDKDDVHCLMIGASGVSHRARTVYMYLKDRSNAGDTC